MSNLSMRTLKGLSKRVSIKEYLDIPEMEKIDIAEYFSFIRFVNRWGGGHRAIRTALAVALDSWPREKEVGILDVGCGMGDIAEAIYGWGRGRGFLIRYKGIDNNSRIIKQAEARTRIEGVEYSQGDIFDQNLPQADIVIASMVFHHFREEEIEDAIVRLFAKSRRALIINDLVRSFSLYSMCYILTRFVKSGASRNDALLSVRKGFRTEEVAVLLNKLNIKGIIKRQFFGRFSVIIFKNKAYYS